MIPQKSARKAWPWPWPWFWTQTMNVTRLTLDYLNCLTLSWWDKTLRWHVRHCYIKSYGTFLKKINDLQNQGHVTSKSNFPSWKHGKTYSTMLPFSNDTKLMLVTCNANDFTSETWLIDYRQIYDHGFACDTSQLTNWVFDCIVVIGKWMSSNPLKLSASKSQRLSSFGWVRLTAWSDAA